jgi:Dyp-type peroxidase family
MPINLNQTNLDITDPNLQTVWGDLQANIVKSHGRNHSRHVFLRFTGDAPACRRWLSEFAGQVTSALTHSQTAEKYLSSGEESLFSSVLLSGTGYAALGVDDATTPDDKAFRAGMKDLEFVYDTVPRGDHRPTANPLNDNIDDWQDEFCGQIDALIVLAFGGSKVSSEAAGNVLDEQVATIRTDTADIAEVVLVQVGHVIRNELGHVMEHFGYADGVSNPLFLKPDIDRARDNGGLDRYDPSAPVGIVLVPDKGGASATESYGSYFVYRKLQQNIKGWHKRVSELADAIGAPRDLAGAMVVGRFEDGTPVGEQSVDGWENLFNNYNFDHDANGLRCPLQSHARKTNPRGDTSRQFGSPMTIESSRRIVRRGISFGSEDLNPTEEWTDAGLLFLSCQSDIEQQFIFMQNTWCNNQNFVSPGIGLDPLVGQPRTDEVVPQHWPTTWGVPRGSVEFPFAGIVKTLGGEYFFAPSISFLRGLASASS